MPIAVPNGGCSRFRNASTITSMRAHERRSYSPQPAITPMTPVTRKTPPTARRIPWTKKGASPLNGNPQSENEFKTRPGSSRQADYASHRENAADGAQNSVDEEGGVAAERKPPVRERIQNQARQQPQSRIRQP